MSFGQRQTLTGPGELLIRRGSARLIEQFGEDASQVLALNPRPAGIVEPSAERFRPTLGNVAPCAFSHGWIEAHGHLGDGHTFSLPPHSNPSVRYRADHPGKRPPAGVCGHSARGLRGRFQRTLGGGFFCAGIGVTDQALHLMSTGRIRASGAQDVRVR